LSIFTEYYNEGAHLYTDRAGAVRLAGASVPIGTGIRVKPYLS